MFLFPGRGFADSEGEILHFLMRILMFPCQLVHNDLHTYKNRKTCMNLHIYVTIIS